MRSLMSLQFPDFHHIYLAIFCILGKSIYGKAWILEICESDFEFGESLYSYMSQANASRTNMNWQFIKIYQIVTN